MGILTWIVLGLIAGAIAKAMRPGRDRGGFLMTAVVGVLGSFGGGFIGSTIVGDDLTGVSLWSILLAVASSLMFLWIYRVSMRSRAL
jgi:uncharacterized membrane protein YeaQ/YmgE (transglycosylase-associated protein family)